MLLILDFCEYSSMVQLFFFLHYIGFYLCIRSTRLYITVLLRLNSLE